MHNSHISLKLKIGTFAEKVTAAVDAFDDDELHDAAAMNQVSAVMLARYAANEAGGDETGENALPTREQIAFVNGEFQRELRSLAAYLVSLGMSADEIAERLGGLGGSAANLMAIANAGADALYTIGVADESEARIKVAQAAE